MPVHEKTPAWAAMAKRIMLPFTDRILEELHAGDEVLLTGKMYVARDAAHKRLVEALDQGISLPVELKGQTIYFMGPSPARPERALGAAGPTSSYRMDAYSVRLLAAGLKCMIGKGMRSQAVKEALKMHKAVYLGAIGGAGALISASIKTSEVVAYEDLGAEAMRLILVEDFPATVVNDIHGGDLYQEGKSNYRQD